VPTRGQLFRSFDLKGLAVGLQDLLILNTCVAHGRSRRVERG
jgi:hypothetical protein